MMRESILLLCTVCYIEYIKSEVKFIECIKVIYFGKDDISVRP